VRHPDQVRRVEDRQRGDTRARQRNALDLVRGDTAVSRGVAGGWQARGGDPGTSDSHVATMSTSPPGSAARSPPLRRPRHRHKPRKPLLGFGVALRLDSRAAAEAAWTPARPPARHDTREPRRVAAAAGPPIEVADKASPGPSGPIRPRAGGGDRPPARSRRAAMKTTCAEAGVIASRYARRLIAEYDRRQHLLSAGAGPLGNGECRGGKGGCAGVGPMCAGHCRRKPRRHSRRHPDLRGFSHVI
jgi:hypothetical protein